MGRRKPQAWAGGREQSRDMNKAHTLQDPQLFSPTIIFADQSSQSGTEITRRNINNHRYTDDTVLMAESEEELKSLLMRVKEESGKAGLKLNIQKTKIMASDLIISWQIDGKKVETVADFIF